MMWISVKNLASVCNPLAHPPWISGMLPLTREEIESRIKRGVLLRYPEYNPVNLIPETREDHINRIAWLVVNGWGDNPISIDFNYGKMFKPFWPLYDGAHRLCAAIIRNNDMIYCDVYGSHDEIKMLSS